MAILQNLRNLSAMPISTSTTLSLSDTTPKASCMASMRQFINSMAPQHLNSGEKQLSDAKDSGSIWKQEETWISFRTPLTVHSSISVHFRFPSDILMPWIPQQIDLRHTISPPKMNQTIPLYPKEEGEEEEHPLQEEDFYHMVRGPISRILPATFVDNKGILHVTVLNTAGINPVEARHASPKRTTITSKKNLYK